MAVHGCPSAVRVDNGPNSRRSFVDWCTAHGAAIHYIQPGKPDQNAYIERFKRHAAWLQTQRWTLPALEQTPEVYVCAVDEAMGRLQAVEIELREFLTLDPLHVCVERLPCFCGIDDLTAQTVRTG